MQRVSSIFGLRIPIFTVFFAFFDGDFHLLVATLRGQCDHMEG